MAATFTFAFVAIGQGDCCLVRCPDGRLVVVDCGRTANKWGDPAWVLEAQLQLRAWAANNANRVDALILTHPDADHHNQVVSFFAESILTAAFTTSGGTVVADRTRLAKIGIDNIYISSAGPRSCLEQYGGAALNSNVYSGFFGTSSVYEVTVNSLTDSANRLRRWDRGDAFASLAATEAVQGKMVSVLSGTTEEDDWRVDVIAGNVSRGYGGVRDEATEDNARSLVTLFTVGSRKALLCGDATLSTEKFLMDAHRARIANAELAQVPHHGSAYASGKGFVNKVNPTAAVVSVGFMEHSYRLPRYEDVLKRWLEVVENRGARLPEHDVDYWYFATTPEELDTVLKIWTRNGTDQRDVGWNENKTFWYLLAPELGNYALYRLTEKGMFLFRERVTSHLRVTSQRTQVYDLTSAGVTAR